MTPRCVIHPRTNTSTSSNPTVVDPIHQLLVSLKDFDILKEEMAQANVLVMLAGGQPNQPISNLSTLITELGLVATAHLADPEILTGQAKVN